MTIAVGVEVARKAYDWTMNPLGRKVISHYLGCTHTRVIPTDIPMDRREQARTAVLNALADAKLMQQVPPRIAQRLLTDEEIAAGKVKFPSSGSRRSRQFKVAVAS